MILKYGWILMIVGVVTFFCGRQQIGHRDASELKSWLNGHGFHQLERIFQSEGISSKASMLELRGSKVLHHSKMPGSVRENVVEAMHVLWEQSKLEAWLYSHDLLDCHQSLETLKVNNFSSLFKLLEKDQYSVCSSRSDWKKLGKAMESVRQMLKKGQEVGSEQDVLRYLKHKNHPTSFAVFVAVWVVIVSPAVVMMLLGNMELPRLRYERLPTSKSAIFELFTGRYPAPQFCEVSWDWTEPQCVGKTMTFSVRFFQKNGTPYPISKEDNVLVEIVHQNAKVATTTEFGSDQPSDLNLARVSFTVHKSGEYVISVMIGGRHIKGSPFAKTFEPGAIDASKTGFMHYSSTVVCAAGTSHPLTIETRDSFNNLAAYRSDQSKHFFKIKVEEAGTGVRYTPATQIIYSVQEKRLTMFIKMEKEGCYQATVSYGDVKLKNGEFSIIVLSGDELAKVKKNVVKRRHNLYYEVRLVACNNEKLEKPKKVYLYISPKQLTLKEFYFKIYPKKLCTYRVCPSTKFYFNGFNNQVGAPSFTIDDGAQPPLVLASKDRNTIAATFSCFMLQRIGGSETFQDKQMFFNHEVRQLHAKKAHTPMPIKVDRSRLLHHSYKVTRHFDLGDWCRLFELSFVGEEGLDWGGLRREWFELLCTELFDPARSGLFMRFSTSPQALVHPNPKRPPDLKLKLYEFAGKVVGKCLFESSLGRPYRQLVKARFSKSFLAQLMGLRVNYKYFETDDPELYTTKIKFIEDNDIEDMELTFTEEEYNERGQLVRTVELIPGGSGVKVTNRNKLQYLDCLAQYRLATSVKDEVECFLRGLNELIPDNLLSIFDEYELELLMCGMGTYSLADFKIHHTVSAPSPSFNKVLDWFWTVIAGFTEEQMARLLQFITGCSQLPPGGFGELNPKVQLSPLHRFNSLPIAHTCFNQLCLPNCDSIELFHKNLLTAINEGSQGFGMV
ncbi:apoptosis-resistant E3 ubiquitin protein ligase 1-like [Littorina saxatilis]|uniref:apoptosis-resistant E3 ubiquitin protein ligase 1-like n=1 Tax=Littorina saxatilis TaxID=31220 RepID=UPI0038B51812